MDRPPPLWDNNVEPQKNLRLPNTPTSELLRAEHNFLRAENNMPNAHSIMHMNPMNLQAYSRDVSIIPQQNDFISSQNCVTVDPRLSVVDPRLPVVDPRLSADAPEFYPASYSRNTAQTINIPHSVNSSVQDRLKRHRQQQNNPEPSSMSSQQDPMRHQQQQQSSYHNNASYNTPSSSLYDDDFVDSPDDTRLKHLIVTLTKDPGQFTDLLDIFMDTLLPYFDNVLVLGHTAQLLVGQAINYPSFRYTGARLCCDIEQNCPTFRAELHLTCKKELEKNPNKSGLLLFVAELYTQLHFENIYGTYLIDAFKHLLAIGGNDNIKSICQALKLTGYSLEKYDKSALDEVLRTLKEVRHLVTGTAQSLIDIVIDLRSRNWGHSSPTNSTSGSESDGTYWGEIAKTVFYNTDGLTLSTEENEFLANNLKSTEEYFLDVSDPDELCDPEPEMDAEIQAAFRDFVKLSKR